MSNNVINKDAILERLNWRYATKSYDAAKKISAEDWHALEQSLILAPSSYGLQPYKYIVVSDSAVREKLRAAAWGQAQVTDASHFVVFAYKKSLTESDVESFIERVVKVRGGSREAMADYENMIKGSARKATDGGFIETWNSRQSYIARGFLLETAALLA